MASRNWLHISKLEDFKQWLIKSGWNIEETKGLWEVLRARKEGRQNPLIIYSKKNAKEHLSVADRDCDVIRAFLAYHKQDERSAPCTENSLSKTVSAIITSVCEDICDNYCKYRETSDDDFQCDIIRSGKACPLDILQ